MITIVHNVPVSRVKVGTKLIADGGFDCLKKGEIVTVEMNEKGELYVPCKDGHHLLDGQGCPDEGDIEYYTGFLEVTNTPLPLGLKQYTFDYVVSVKQLIPTEMLSKSDDRLNNPSGEYLLRDKKSEQDALDEFHRTVPIGCLDDFAVTVSKITTVTLK